MDPEQVFQWAQEQLAGGANPEQVDAIISRQTEHPNFFGLRMAMEAAGHDAERAEAVRQDISEHPLRSFVGSAVQGLTLGTIDEALAPIIGEERAARMRLAQNERQEFAPGADVASQIAGGLLMPGAAGARALTRAPGAARGLLAGAARGGLTGATTGAVAGAGFSAPGERLENARRGALWGGLGGAALTAPFGAAAGLWGSRAGQGARIAQDLVEKAEVPTANRFIARGNIADAKELIQDIYYRPLEEGGEAIMDPVLNQTVADLAQDELIGNTISANLKGRIGPMAAGETIEAGEGIMFAEAQQIRRELRDIAFDFQSDAAQRRAARRAADQIDDAMQDAFGEPLIRADALWRRASDRGRALEQGIKMANGRAEDIQEALFEMSEHQQIAFREGMLSEWLADLTSRHEEVVPRMAKMFDAGPETRTVMRTFFPANEAGEAAFEAFTETLASEASTAKRAEIMRRIMQSSAVGFTTGVVAGTAASIGLGRGGGGGGGN